MADIILPAFLRFPAEAAIIGRLLAGYGELEFELMMCVGVAISDPDAVLKAMFRARGEKDRIDIADALGRRAYGKLGLETQFSEAVASTQHCRQIRNQFAHCHWHDDNTGKLGFVHLTEIATQNAVADPRNLTIKFVDAPLLEAQETYFRFTARCLIFLNFQGRLLTGEIPKNPLPAPKKLLQPPYYIP